MELKEVVYLSVYSFGWSCPSARLDGFRSYLFGYTTIHHSSNLRSFVYQQAESEVTHNTKNKPQKPVCIQMGFVFGVGWSRFGGIDYGRLQNS